MKYTLHNPLLGVQLQDKPEAPILLRLPTDSVVELIGEPDMRGLVRILYQGLKLEVFSRDLEDRAYAEQ